jgi:hypothetical protein
MGLFTEAVRELTKNTVYSTKKRILKEAKEKKVLGDNAAIIEYNRNIGSVKIRKGDLGYFWLTDADAYWVSDFREGKRHLSNAEELRACIDLRKIIFTQDPKMKGKLKIIEQFEWRLLKPITCEI